jgi:DNA repair protein RecO (recombination protein O)
MFTKPRTYKTEAVVLKQVPIGEADRVVSLFTPGFGKVRAVVKGSRRPKSRLAGHLEPLVYSRLMLVRGRDLDIVSGAETIRSFSRIREHLELVGRALVCAELVDAFVAEGQENRRLFSSFIQVLNSLDSGAGDLAIWDFEVRLLGFAGYMPELYDCVSCRNRVSPGQHRFSFSLGGVLCVNCAENRFKANPFTKDELYSIDFPIGAIKVLRFMQNNAHQDVQRLNIDQRLGTVLENIIHGYTTFILEQRLKTRGFLEDLKSLT